MWHLSYKSEHAITGYIHAYLDNLLIDIIIIYGLLYGTGYLQQNRAPWLVADVAKFLRHDRGRYEIVNTLWTKSNSKS